MEIFVDVWMEHRNSAQGRQKCNEAIYTFVAVDQLGNPITVPSIIVKQKSKRCVSMVL